MSTYQVEESAIVDARAAQVYALISDYREGHPAILPARYFEEMQVLQGGQGAGTVVSTRINVFGAVSSLQLIVSEPEPGRILREEDASAGVVTTFTVDPVGDGAQSKVTIATTARTNNTGFIGWLEKLVTAAVTRRIYREELAQLTRVVRSGSKKKEVERATE